MSSTRTNKDLRQNQVNCRSTRQSLIYSNLSLNGVSLYLIRRKQNLGRSIVAYLQIISTTNMFCLLELVTKTTTIVAGARVRFACKTRYITTPSFSRIPWSAHHRARRVLRRSHHFFLLLLHRLRRSRHARRQLCAFAISHGRVHAIRAVALC